jgi:hypothetical protein
MNNKKKKKKNQKRLPEIAASPLREDTIFLLSDSGQDPSFVLLFFGFNF